MNVTRRLVQSLQPARASTLKYELGCRRIIFRHGRASGFTMACLLFMLCIGLALALSSCVAGPEPDLEILIGVEPEHAHSLISEVELKPSKTGILSLDALNEKWSVLEISLVFPDVSPGDEVASRYGLSGVVKLVVPADTDVKTMLDEYQADPHVAYAEVNETVEIK